MFHKESTMKKQNDVATLQAKAVVKLDAAVDELAAEAREKAVASAAEVIKGRILDFLDKDAAVRKMRRESIAKARSVLAVKRKESAKPKKGRTKVKPQITTELPPAPAKTTKVKGSRGAVLSPEALHASASRQADV